MAVITDENTHSVRDAARKVQKLLKRERKAILEIFEERTNVDDYEYHAFDLLNGAIRFDENRLAWLALDNQEFLVSSARVDESDGEIVLQLVQKILSVLSENDEEMPSSLGVLSILSEMSDDDFSRWVFGPLKWSIDMAREICDETRETKHSSFKARGLNFEYLVTPGRGVDEHVSIDLGYGPVLIYWHWGDQQFYDLKDLIKTAVLRQAKLK